MTKTKRLLTIISLLIISILCNISCRSDQPLADCFPHSTVQVRLLLDHPSYQALQQLGGWVYVAEQQSGTRGLIVVNTPQGFYVYDRNAPHLCPESNTTLMVENQTKVVCPKDQSEWNLINGQAISGTSTPLKRYRYQYETSTNTLILFN